MSSPLYKKESYSMNDTSFVSGIRILKHSEETELEFTGAEATSTYYSLYFLYHGYRSFLIGGQRCVLSEGQVLLVPPSMSCASRTIPGLNEDVWLLQLKDTLLVELARSAGMKGAHASILTDGGAHLYQMVTDSQGFFAREGHPREPQLPRLKAELEEENASHSEILIRSALSILLIQILRTPEMPLPTPRTGRGKPSLDMKEVVCFIRKHYREDISLTTLSEVFMTTDSALSRTFKKQLNDSPITCLNRVRIDAAKQLLKEELSMSLADVAKTIGFESLTYFGRVFKQLTGITPTEYRKNRSKPSKV